jgi:hypothetical protein
MRLRCARGHALKADLATCINLRTDRELLNDLALTGLSTTACTKCRIECQVALPVFLFDPENERAALYIPNQISFMEIYIRAVFMNELVRAEAIMPAYVGDLEILVGSAALVEWKEERQKSTEKTVESRKEIDRAETGAGEKEKPPARNTGFIRTKPSIRDAFADLDDEGRPTLPPGMERESEPEIDTDLEEDDDDWLDDSALNISSKSKNKARGFDDGGSEA